MRKLISVRALVAAAIVASPFALQAQDKLATKTTAKTTAAPAAATAKADAAKAPAKRKGQVPPYFGEVATDVQKDKIYSLQISYAEKIAAAKAALDAVTAERDAAIDAVLSPEQQAQVAKLKADAEKARKEKADAAKKPAKT